MHSIKLISSLAFIIYLHLCRAGDPCPLPEQMRYCTCMRKENVLHNQSIVVDNSTSSLSKIPLNQDSSRNLRSNSTITTVECNLVPTIDSLEEDIVSGLQRREIDKLTLYRVPPEKEHTLAHLPNEWLKNTRVGHLEIFDSKLYGDFLWFGNPFKGQEHSLLTLSVKKCFLYGALTLLAPDTIQTRYLNVVPKLEIIDFSQNALTTISNSAFDHPPANLSTIILSHNCIKKVESGAFTSVLKLKSIDLSHNRLDSLERGIFPSRAELLDTINLSWNILEELPPNFFKGMPLLKSVNLEKNYLYSMPEFPWSDVWSLLDFINIEGNFINCDCNLLWLWNATITSTAASPSSSRVFKGNCSYNKASTAEGVQYPLDNLKRNSLMCETETQKS